MKNINEMTIAELRSMRELLPDTGNFERIVETLALNQQIEEMLEQADRPLRASEIRCDIPGIRCTVQKYTANLRRHVRAGKVRRECFTKKFVVVPLETIEDESTWEVVEKTFNGYVKA